jgi:hypothetical protein
MSMLRYRTLDKYLREIYFYEEIERNFFSNKTHFFIIFGHFWDCPSLTLDA